jgi:hypothetical protein
MMAFALASCVLGVEPDLAREATANSEREAEDWRIRRIQAKKVG